MHTPTYVIDYEDAISVLVRKLPMERAAQLYDFARFLVEDARSTTRSRSVEEAEMEYPVSDEELAAEDLLWEASMRGHADRFAALKAQAKADVRAQRTAPMFDESGEFIVE